MIRWSGYVWTPRSFTAGKTRFTTADNKKKLAESHSAFLMTDSPSDGTLGIDHARRIFEGSVIPA